MKKSLLLVKNLSRTLRCRLTRNELPSFSTLTFLYYVLRFIVDGMELFLILPTAWYYIASFGQTNAFLGATLAAHSMAALLFSVFIGELGDRLRIYKTIIFFGGLLKLFGNLLYAIPVSAYCPLFGRFISGIADGSLGVMYGVLAKCTDDRNRAKAFVLCESLFNVGTALAPVIGSFLTFNLNILGWKIGVGNSPGFVLAIIWFFLLILTGFLPRNLGCDDSAQHLKMNDLDTKIDKAESVRSPNPVPVNLMQRFNSRICCLLFHTFTTGFLFCMTLFYSPLLAAHVIHLRLIHVKLLFLNGTLSSFIFFLFVYISSAYFSERSLITVAVALQLCPIITLSYFALFWNNVGGVHAAYILLVLMLFGILCFSFPVSCSVLSKLTSVNQAAFYQGLMFTVIHASIISSRLIAGATFNKSSLGFVCAGLSLLWVVQTVWLAVEYQRLQPADDNK